LSFRPACTTTRKLPFGSMSAGVDDPVVTFRMKTLSCTPAVPCVPVTTLSPFASGIVALRLPAGGAGGGLVSRLVNVVS